MKMHESPVKVYNPMAVSLRSYKKQVVSSKKGKGSYKRNNKHKGKKYV